MLVSRASTGIWFPLIQKERYHSWWHSASPRTYTTFAYQLNAGPAYRSQWSTMFAWPVVYANVPGAIVIGARKIETLHQAEKRKRARSGRLQTIFPQSSRQAIGAEKRAQVDERSGRGAHGAAAPPQPSDKPERRGLERPA